MPSLIVWPGAPLIAVDRPKRTIFTCPLIPYTHAMLLQVVNISIPTQEPQELIYDTLQMQLLRRQEWEALT